MKGDDTEMSLLPQKTECSANREEEYFINCLKLTFRFGDKLKTGNQVVYLMKSGEIIEIGKPVNFKTFWYETWSKLKSFYGES